MTKEKALEAWKQMRSEIDSENWLFVGTINPAMVEIAIDAIEESINREVDHVEKLSSADRPQWKWKAKSFHEFFCDNCGFSFDMMQCDFLENMNFCPNCGADMREKS